MHIIPIHPTADLNPFDKAENLMKEYNITVEELLTCKISRAHIAKITEI